MVIPNLEQLISVKRAASGFKLDEEDIYYLKQLVKIIEQQQQSAGITPITIGQ